MLQRLSITAFLAGFIALGGLLLTGHYGFAIKFTNYFYFFLLSIIFWRLARHVKEK